ncbi:MAG: ParB family chromosome partitioning protein [Paraglaciecola sp.]
MNYYILAKRKYLPTIMAKKVVRKASKKILGGSIDSLLGQRKNSGTDALFGTTNVPKVIANTIANILIDQIEANPGQPRKDFDQRALEELASSISEHGIIQPITVRKISETLYQIISGERRWRASQLADLKEIPAYVRDVDNAQLFEMAIVENLQREDLSTREFVNSLKDLKYSVDPPLLDEVIAKKIGKKRSTVTNYLRILTLENAMQESIDIGEITFGHAKALAGIKDSGLRKDIYDEVIENGLSVRALEARIKAEKEGTHEPEEKKLPTKKSDLSTEYEAVQKTLKSFFGNGKVRIKVDEEKGKGQIVLPFNSVKELNQMLDLLES